MNVASLRVCDTSQYSRESPEYRLGVSQLKQWHEQCRCKRLGIPFRQFSMTKIAVSSRKYHGGES